MIGRACLDTRGASLLEAVIAAGLLATVLTSVLPLTATTLARTAAWRAQLQAAHLARQRLAQLQALTHLQSAGGVAVDTASGFVPDAFATAGPGLTPSGLASLHTSIPGWSEALDAHGASLGPSEPWPPGARFSRRWSVITGSGDPCLRVWVEVTARGPVGEHHVQRAGAVQCPWGVPEP